MVTIPKIAGGFVCRGGYINQKKGGKRSTVLICTANVRIQLQLVMKRLSKPVEIFKKPAAGQWRIMHV
jgi:hypothetical protein